MDVLMEVIKPTGALGISGGAPTDLKGQGKMTWSSPKAWEKSPSLTAGQFPVMRYNRDLMMAILWERMPCLKPHAKRA